MKVVDNRTRRECRLAELGYGELFEFVANGTAGPHMKVNAVHLLTILAPLAKERVVVVLGADSGELRISFTDSRVRRLHAVLDIHDYPAEGERL